MYFPANLVQMYFDRFVNRSDLYFFQRWNSERYWYDKAIEPVTLNVIDRHLYGTHTLGFLALNDGMCRWCCWDADNDGPWLDRLEALLIAHGWFVVREGRREGREGHLWVFFDLPVPAKI